MRTVYLDYNATTPVDPSVVEAMNPIWKGAFGNPSSVHSFGRDAKVALENARECAAELLGVEPSEIVFTSGGTEGDNLAVKGIMRSQTGARRRVVVSTIEHSAVRDSALALAAEGFSVAEVPVTHEGFVTPNALAAKLGDDVALVSIMHANNEIGSAQDIPNLSALAHSRGALFHTDAVQSFGKIPVRVPELGVDLLTLSAHKIYGPKGAGLVYIKSGVKIAPLFHGGSQEKKRRTGTENVALAVGLTKAMALAVQRQESEYERLFTLAEGFWRRMKAEIPDVTLNGSELSHKRVTRLPSTLNVSFQGVEGEPLILSLDLEGVAVASGSACHAGAVDPSHVLVGIGRPVSDAKSAIRFSLGVHTTDEDINYVCDLLPGIVSRLRSLSPSRARALN